ncbi:hypothetical protein C8Q73DRAFT_711566 [Cubamyces lactineus]|nr:hypothetical protein C8Q73DRAFT_711566 [Cubamyces lactineus]
MDIGRSRRCPLSSLSFVLPRILCWLQRLCAGRAPGRGLRSSDFEVRRCTHPTVIASHHDLHGPLMIRCFAPASCSMISRAHRPSWTSLGVRRVARGWISSS